MPCTPFSANACQQRWRIRWSRTTSCQNGSKRACRGYRMSIQLIACQTRKKCDGKWRFFRATEEGDVSKQGVIANLGASEALQRLQILS